MGLLSRIGSWWGGGGPGATQERSATSTDKPADWFLDWALQGSKSTAGVRVSQMRAMQEMTFMACIAIRASDLAKCPLHVYRRSQDGGQVVAKDHPLEQLLRKPNGWQNRLRFVEQMQAAALVKSNAYAGIVRDGRGRPIELIPFWPTRVQLRVTPGGDLCYHVLASNDHERFHLAKFAINPIPAADMLHVRWLSFDGLHGLSRIHLAREALGLSLALEEHSSRLFSNGARPGGVLETEKRLSDPVFERFKTQWAEFFTGVENAGKTPILEEGLKWSSQAMTSVDAQTIEARRHQREEIATACEVPLHRLGIGQDKDAGVLQTQQQYRNNTLSTDAERLEDELDLTFGLDGEEIFTAFDLDYFNRADIQTRMTAYRTGIVGMVMKPNEARLREGLPRVDGGDTLYQPTNVAPIGFMPNGSENGPGSDVTGAPAPGGDGDPAAVPLD